MPLVVEQSVQVNAAPEAVWRALTDPDVTEKYFFKSRVKSDWRPGSAIEFRRTFLGVIPFVLRGVITQADPGRRLQYKLFHHRFFGEPGPDEYSLVTDVLEPAGGGTRLSITDDVGTTKGAERRYSRSVKGWQSVLSGLQRVFESGE